MNQKSERKPIAERPKKGVAVAGSMGGRIPFEPPHGSTSPIGKRWHYGLIVCCCLLAHGNSWFGKFVFDDVPNVLNNESLRDWRKPWRVWEGQGRNRPVTYLTFMANYAWNGADPRGYHAVNLAIHALNGVLIAACLRRILMAPGASPACHRMAPALALAVALVWVVHPLTTQAVTYVYQRLESLASLFYLLTLFGFLQGVRSRNAAGWWTLSVLASGVGMLTKEMVFTAPLVVYCVDAVLFKSGWWGALRTRAGYYLALFGTMLIPPGMVLVFYQHYREEGLLAASEYQLPPLIYLYCQGTCICHYLMSAVAPVRLALDPGWGVPSRMVGIPCFMLTSGLVIASAIGLLRRQAWSLLGVAYFLILAPTSSVAPIVDVMFEQRTYLALVSPLLLLALLFQQAMQRIIPSTNEASGRLPAWGPLLLGLIVLAFSAATISRNRLFAQPDKLFADNIRKYPQHSRGHTMLGIYLLDQKDFAAAQQNLERAIELDPQETTAWINLAILHGVQRQVPQLKECLVAARTFPDNYSVWTLLEKTKPYVEEAPELDPDVLVLLQRIERKEPDLVEAQLELANWEVRNRQESAARKRLEGLLARGIRPAAVYNALGTLLMQQGEATQGIAYLSQAVALIGNSPAETHLGMRLNLAQALALQGKSEAAEAVLRQALLVKPGYPLTCAALGRILSATRPAEAERYFLQALAGAPEEPETQFNWSVFLLSQGRHAEAMESLQRLLGQHPEHAQGAQLLQQLTVGN